MKTVPTILIAASFQRLISEPTFYQFSDLAVPPNNQLESSLIHFFPVNNLHVEKD